MSSSAAAPLLDKEVAKKKQRVGLGYLPVWSEFVPLDQTTGAIDWPGVVVNIGSGFIMGVRETLGGIVSASLVFSSASPEITEMLPWGISMTLYTMTFAVLWYTIFGRLQYGYATQQDLICILQAEMANKAAQSLAAEPAKIAPTVVAIICASSILSGLCSIFIGKLGLGSYMLYFPTPVINGFLGAIGVVVIRAGLQTASGVKFHWFYPLDPVAFCSANSLAQVGCAATMLLIIKYGPTLLVRCFPKSHAVQRLSGLLCQLLPLFLFYVVVWVGGISMATLTQAGWTYPDQGSSGPRLLWTTYSPKDVDWPTVYGAMPDMPPLIMMAVMCTMVGALAITDKFPTGPPGDPQPTDPIDFDMELSTVGASSILLGCTGGNLNFHKFSVIQLRLDGGTHRIAVLMIAAVSGGLFVLGVPLGHIVPKWFLAGLFLNTGMHFLKGTVLSYREMAQVTWRGWKLPSPQYSIGLVCITMAIFASPAQAIMVGLGLSCIFFLVSSSSASPVISVAVGDRVLSRTMRPFWEMDTLRIEGCRIVMLYLQGQLFFGSTHRLVTALNSAAADAMVQYIIISLARVPRVDPSAVRHLKITVDKLRNRGCKVMFCRMNKDVYSTLSASKVVLAPGDELLKHLENLRWKVREVASPRPSYTTRKERSRQVSRQVSPLGSPGNSPKFGPRGGVWSLDSAAFDAPVKMNSASSTMPANSKVTLVGPYTPPRTSLSAPMAQPPPALALSERLAKLRPSDLRPSEHPDAFCHETDALDYCDEQVVTEFCYGSSKDPWVVLEPYMLAYRKAVDNVGMRLPTWAFEEMNHLHSGFMDKLKPFCTVHDDVPAWTKMNQTMSSEGALLFIFKGSLSVIKVVPHVVDGASSSVQGDVTGFTFREGKKLLKRYTPGHIAGTDSFFVNHFLRQIGRNLDPELDPKYVVSSKVSPPAEIWVLQPDAWELFVQDHPTFA